MSTTLARTLALLAHDKGQWVKTAEATGLGREWLVKLARGFITDPGITKIETLEKYLTEKYPDFALDSEETAAQ
jgi:hypothetical protein